MVAEGGESIWRRELVKLFLKPYGGVHPRADVICGHERPLCAVMCSWHHIFYFLQAMKPKRRVFGLGAALHADGDPSGAVPGADAGDHGSSPSLSSGGEEGLDCFLNF
jgi:hypothetical protein